MDEASITQTLKQNIPESQQTIIAPAPEMDTTQGQAKDVTTYTLDELTQYKLHDLFGQQYRPNDEITKQQLSYIYKEVSAMTEESDYGLIAAKIRDLQRMTGISNADNRIYRLYQWLKLNNVRRNVDAQMESVANV